MLCCLGGEPNTPPTHPVNHSSTCVSSTCVSSTPSRTYSSTISFISVSSTDSPTLTRVSPPTMKYPDEQIINTYQLSGIINFIEKPQTIQYSTSQLRIFDHIKNAK